MCFSSCGSQSSEVTGPCTIEGSTGIVEYDKIYLRDAAMGIIDSTFVQEGRFAFQIADTVSMPVIVSVQFCDTEAQETPIFMSVALEPGVVKLHIDDMIELSGTALNDRIQAYYDEMQLVYDACTDQTVTVDDAKAMYSDFCLKQIIKNRKNVLGAYLLESYSHVLLPEDLAKAEKKLQ